MNFGCQDQDVIDLYPKHSLNFTQRQANNIQPSRMHNIGDYQHIYTPEQLANLMEDYVFHKQPIENDCIQFITNELNNSESESLFMLDRVYTKFNETSMFVRSLPLLYKIILMNLHKSGVLNDKLQDVLKSYNETECSNIQAELQNYPEFYKPDLFDKIMLGEHEICHSAVYLVINVITKCAERCENFFDELESVPKPHTVYKELTVSILMLAYCFKYL